MLPAERRLTDAASFRTTTRRGRRAARATLVAHVLTGDGASGDPARFGFVVSRAVGNAVVRNRVRRRLRHAAASELGSVPSGSRVVVRALPASASASYGDLADDLHGALSSATGR